MKSEEALKSIWKIPPAELNGSMMKDSTDITNADAVVEDRVDEEASIPERNEKDLDNGDIEEVMERLSHCSLDSGNVEMTNESKPKANTQVKFQLEEQTVRA